MSRVKDGLTDEQIDKAFLELIKEENERMLAAPKTEKLLTYKQLGVKLAEKLGRQSPFSDKFIYTHMDYYKLKSDRSVKQYVKTKIVVSELYVYPPPLIYLKITDEKEIKSVISFCKSELPNVYLDYVKAENGILLIGKSDKFPSIFESKYTKAAKEVGVKYKKEETP